MMVDFTCVKCGKTKGLKHKAFGKCVNCYHNDVYHRNQAEKRKSLSTGKKKAS